MIAASIAWVYGTGREPHTEDEQIDVNVPEPTKTMMLGVLDLEQRVLHSSPLAGVVLRNGHLYGPGTGHDSRDEVVSVYVDAASHAALLALQGSVEGIFNIVDDNDRVSNAKARQVLGWNPH
jgi:nucleoside-diphosphate-sugar epimerase